MKGINKCIIVGHLGQDPESRVSQSGTAMATLSVATSESWKDKQTGQQQDRTEWHRVVFFNRLAEIAGQYLKKGSKVYIEGSLRTRKWQDNTGADRYTTEIIGSEMQMLDSKGDNAGGGYQQNQGQQQAPQQNYQQQAPQQRQQAPQQQQQQQAPQQNYQQQAPQQQQAPHQQQTQASQNNAPAGFDEFNDDIPF